jgi:hypothetical protein
VKYLLKWTSDRPENATEDRFISRIDAENYVQSFLPQAQFLAVAPKPDRVLNEMLYIWKSLDALQSGKPHSATITPLALGNTLQIDAAFARAARQKEDGK